MSLQDTMAEMNASMDSIIEMLAALREMRRETTEHLRAAADLLEHNTTGERE